MKYGLINKALGMFLTGLYSGKKKAKGYLNILQKAENFTLKKNSTILKLGTVSLKNKRVMIGSIKFSAFGVQPKQIEEEYYKQRSTAGLIITEGTSPSVNGAGSAHAPGIYNKRQVEIWEKTTSEVHKEGGKIFINLNHTGRLSHPLNMGTGSEILAPSAIKATGRLWTDSNKMQDFPVPKAMTNSDLWQTKIEFAIAVKNAIEAGFDGIELNASNGNLFEQFLSPISNIRSDDYGGSIENRCRFLIEVTTSISDIIGKGKTGIRLSPYSMVGDMQYYTEIEETYKYLAAQLNKTGVAYIHLVKNLAMGTPDEPKEILTQIINQFNNTIIYSEGFDTWEDFGNDHYGLWIKKDHSIKKSKKHEKINARP